MEKQQQAASSGSSNEGKKKKNNDDAAAAADDELELDDDVIFASLDASLQQQQVYEEQVIREATHQLAPPLTGIGFPDLSALMMHSATGRAAATAASAGHNSNNRAKKNNAVIDLPPMHAVLTQVRKDQQEEPHQADIHYLKEQMLLHFMSTVAGVARQDLPDRSSHDDMDIQKRQQRPASSADSNVATATSRQQKQSSAAAGAAVAAAPLHSRVSIMKRKRKQQQQQDVHDDDDNDDIAKETNEHRARLKELRRQRQQRRAERRKVLYSNNQIHDHSEDDEMEFMDNGSNVVVTGNDANDDDDDDRQEEEEEEANNVDSSLPLTPAFTEEVNMSIWKDASTKDVDEEKPGTRRNSHDGIGKEPDEVSSSTINNNNNMDSSAVAAAATTTGNSDNSVIQCPLCQEPVTCFDLSQMDAVLAAHMAQCQQQESNHGRSRRRSSRRAAAQQTVRYCEEEEDEQVVDDSEQDDNDDANDDPTWATVARSRSSRNQQVKSNKRPLPKQAVAATAGAVVAESALTNTVAIPMALDDMNYEHYEDRVDEWILNGLANMKVMKELDTSVALPGPADLGNGLIVPAWINDRLFGYQREGIAWLWDLHRQQAGGMLGDEMGLGKTVSASSYLGILASCRKLRSVLVVAPATMLQHWLKELAVWAPGLRRVLIHQSAGEKESRRSISRQLLQSLSKWLDRVRADRVNECIDEEDRLSMEPHSFCGTGYVIVTTYENVRRNPDIYVQHSWSYVVIDEAQTIRNPDADITLVIKRLRTPHRLALSGTPIQNNLRELWSIFDFVFPGRLGTLPTFEQEFADPIKRGGYSNASPMQVQLAYRCALVLRDLINPYLLRRQKKDVKEVSRMPGKTEHVLFCRLSKRQRALYEAYLHSDEVSSVVRGSTQLLKAITVLRKICNHPDLVCEPKAGSVESIQKNGFPVGQLAAEDSDDDDDNANDGIAAMKDYDDESAVERSGKLEVLSKILPLWKRQGHRVIIFCQWRKMLNIIQRFVMMKGWKFGRLDGNTSVAARQRLVDKFNSDDSYFVLLATTRTGGVGLNMTGANRVILYDPDWNPQTDAQARERAWRFGQEREVTIYRLIVAGSVEEKIYQRQIFKTALSNKVLQDPRQRRLFSQRDLRDLFTLKPDTGSYRSGGGDGMETVEMAKGTTLDIEDDDTTNDDAKDNEATLKSVMKSKGLAGVFDHHFVEQDSSRKSVSVLEMEEKAKTVAREAVNMLRQSVASTADESFTPTPTGRFGGGSASVGGVRRGSTTSGSGGLLASLKQRDVAVKTGGKSASSSKEQSARYTKLLSRIEVYVKRQRPTTDQLLKEFESIPDDEGAIFRRLLKSVASVKNGRWQLKRD